MDGVGTTGEVTNAQLVIMKIAMEKTEDKANFFSLMNIVSHFHKSDKAGGIDLIINPGWLYGIILPTMRYERNGNSFSCIGVRGFDYEGFSIHAPVA